MASKVDLETIKGDTKTVNVTIWTDSTKTTKVNITGYEFWLTVKNRYSDTDAEAVIQKVPADFTITDNVAQCVISNTENDIDVKAYKYDIQYKDLSGNITTPAYGTYAVLNEVTEATL